MKKIKRLIAALLLCVLVLSCAGCANLDEMKATHGIFLDEQGLEIQLNGAVYKEIPKSNLEIINYRGVSIDVTQSDVPVLLKEQYGKSASISDNGVFLEGHWLTDNRQHFYCRADQYDAVMKEINEGPTLSEMTYDYWDYENGEHKLYVLTAEQRAAVEKVLAGEGQLLEGYKEDYNVRLCYTSKSLLFREGIGYLSYWNGNYRLIIPQDGQEWGYPVPQELNPIFDAIMKPYKEVTNIY